MATAAKAAKSRIVGMAQGVLESKAVVIAQIRSNKTAMCNELRAELSKSDGKLKFLKNSLASVAAKKVTNVKKERREGGSFPKVSPSTSFIFYLKMPERAPLANLLHGQVCFIYTTGDDPMATIKVPSSFVDVPTDPSIMCAKSLSFIFVNCRLQLILNKSTPISLFSAVLSTTG